MKKNILWLILLAIVIVLVIYFSSRGAGVLNSGVSLRDLLEANLEQKCTINQVADGARSEGTIYTSAGQLRADFYAVDADQQETSAHILLTDNSIYTWLDGFNLGIMAPLDSGTNSEGISIDRKSEYQCASWEPDPDLFELPDNIEFTEVSAG